MRRSETIGEQPAGTRCPNGESRSDAGAIPGDAGTQTETGRADTTVCVEQGLSTRRER